MYNFEAVEKLGNVNERTLPFKTIRVSKNTMAIGQDLVTRYSMGKTEKGFIWTILKIEHDPVNQAIRLTKDNDGFRWSTNSTENTSINRRIPAALKKKGTLIVGDYVETEPYSNIFVLAK